MKIAPWKFTKNGEQTMTNNWLENRFFLFKNYCLPSVKNQKNKNFKWIIFFDIDTPDKFLKEIDEIKKDFDIITAVYIAGMDEMLSSLLQLIKREQKNEEFIITTRIDNDDLIHNEFIDTIQKLFVPKDKTVIDIIKGYQVIIETNTHQEVRLYEEKKYNPFLSVIETIKNPETVFGREHLQWHNEKTIFYEQQPLWIELVHQTNKLNVVNKTLKHVNLENSAFGIDKNIYFKKLSFLNMLVLNMKVILIKMWKRIK